MFSDVLKATQLVLSVVFTIIVTIDNDDDNGYYYVSIACSLPGSV